MDTTAITAAHAARLAAVDPLVPDPVPLPESVGRTLRAERGASAGAAVAWFVESAPETAALTWDAARRHNLEVRLAGPERAEVLGDLLDQWAELLGGVEPGDADSAAVVELPSRDTESALPLLRRGFAPVAALAVRRAGTPVPAPDPAVLVRAATVADLDRAVELNMEVVAYDAPFNKVTPRPETAEVLRNQLAFLLELREPSVWVAELDGRVVGLAHLQVPPTSNWAQRYARVDRVGYLACLGVTESVRGSGVGTALAARAHAVLDGAGLPVTLLHHALPNPRSTPFWYRHGYRPLWTTWTRRPVRG